MPLKGRIVPELKIFNIDIYREIIENPWRIIYRVQDKEVIILSVIDGRRNIEDIIFEKLLGK
jgi:Txe/YoeB family toxin of Txe-Axe toxin-antitoxin module